MHNGTRKNSQVNAIISHLHRQANHLSQVHQEFIDRLQSASAIYVSEKEINTEWERRENIFEVLIKMKRGFLAYGPFVASCQNASRLLSLMNHDRLLRLEVEQLDMYLINNLERKAGAEKPQTIFDLMSLPAEHILG